MVRRVKKIWVSDSGTVSRLVYVSAATFTMVAGRIVAGPVTTTGYSIPSSIGTFTPTVDPEGNAINFLTWNTSTSDIVLGISIASNPGINYFDTMTITNGGSTYSAAAASYGYSGGVAEWAWSSPSFGFIDGSTYLVTIDY